MMKTVDVAQDRRALTATINEIAEVGIDCVM
jgi:hypothetical protein